MTTHDAGGVQLAVDDSGGGPAVLSMHGFMGTAATWRRQAAALVERHRLIGVDLLGHGGSERSYDPDRYDLAVQADGIATLLSGLGIERCHVVGYSMGARLALRFAIDHADRVGRLVLESPAAGLADPRQRAKRIAEDERLADALERDGIEAFIDAWERKPMFASYEALPMGLRAEIRRERMANDPLALAACLRGAGQGVMEPMHERLAGVTAPALVIAGELDTAGAKRARQVSAAMPDARLLLLADAGHAPHLERAEPVGIAIAAFLDATVSTDQTDEGE